MNKYITTEPKPWIQGINIVSGISAGIEPIASKIYQRRRFHMESLMPDPNVIDAKPEEMPILTMDEWMKAIRGSMNPDVKGILSISSDVPPGDVKVVRRQFQQSICKHDWKPSNSEPGKTQWCSICDSRS